MKIKANSLQLILFSILFLSVISCKGQKKHKKKATIDTSRPNIIVIVADDMGWYDLGCYSDGFIETPNLNHFAKEGIKFTNGYAAAPLCSPSRASLITGLNPIEVNITEHIHGNHPAGPHQKLKTPPIDQHLDLKYTTDAEALKKINYKTAQIGKWHLGGGKFLPQAQGYDLNIAGAWNGLPKSFFYPFFPMGQKPKLQNSSKKGDYLPDVLTDNALKFINKQKDSNFFLSLNYYAPHVPIEAKKELVEKYIKKRGTNDESILPNIYYAAMIDAIDQNVGRILRRLDSLGIAKNTLVVFTSDNGGLSVEEVPGYAKHTPPTDNGPLKAGKGYLYEGGIREPFMVRWPAVIAPNQTNDTPIIDEDLFNTFVDITGAGKGTDAGTSLMPIFKGSTLPKRELLWHMPHYSPQHGKPCSALRNGDWKILHFYEDDRYELYNLSDDIGESHNLAKHNPKKLKEMKDKLASELKRMGAKFPEPNPDYVEK